MFYSKGKFPSRIPNDANPRHSRRTSNLHPPVTANRIRHRLRTEDWLCRSWHWLFPVCTIRKSLVALILLAERPKPGVWTCERHDFQLEFDGGVRCRTKSLPRPLPSGGLGNPAKWGTAPRTERDRHERPAAIVNHDPVRTRTWRVVNQRVRAIEPFGMLFAARGNRFRHLGAAVGFHGGGVKLTHDSKPSGNMAPLSAAISELILWADADVARG